MNRYKNQSNLGDYQAVCTFAKSFGGIAPCLNGVSNVGRDLGRLEGREEGRREGFEAGYKNGSKDGFRKGAVFGVVTGLVLGGIAIADSISNHYEKKQLLKEIAYHRKLEELNRKTDQQETRDV